MCWNSGLWTEEKFQLLYGYSGHILFIIKVMYFFFHVFDHFFMQMCLKVPHIDIPNFW